VDQFVARWHVLALPRCTAVGGEQDKAVGHNVTTRKITDDPALLLVGEANAVEFRQRAAEFIRQKLAHLSPRCAAVCGAENASACEQITVLFVAEIEIVDRFRDTDLLLRPTTPAVLCAPDLPAIARHP